MLFATDIIVLHFREYHLSVYMYDNHMFVCFVCFIISGLY